MRSLTILALILTLSACSFPGAPPTSECEPGQLRDCPDGPGTNEGVCRAGIQRCDGNGYWPRGGQCVGAVYPSTIDLCGNDRDDDCDGTIDEEPSAEVEDAWRCLAEGNKSDELEVLRSPYSKLVAQVNPSPGSPLIAPRGSEPQRSLDVLARRFIRRNAQEFGLHPDTPDDTLRRQPRLPALVLGYDQYYKGLRVLGGWIRFFLEEADDGGPPRAIASLTASTLRLPQDPRDSAALLPRDQPGGVLLTRDEACERVVLRCEPDELTGPFIYGHITRIATAAGDEGRGTYCVTPRPVWRLEGEDAAYLIDAVPTDLPPPSDSELPPWRQDCRPEEQREPIIARFSHADALSARVVDRTGNDYGPCDDDLCQDVEARLDRAVGGFGRYADATLGFDPDTVWNVLTLHWYREGLRYDMRWNANPDGSGPIVTLYGDDDTINLEHVARDVGHELGHGWFDHLFPQTRGLANSATDVRPAAIEEGMATIIGVLAACWGGEPCIWPEPSYSGHPCPYNGGEPIDPRACGTTEPDAPDPAPDADRLCLWDCPRGEATQKLASLIIEVARRAFERRLGAQGPQLRAARWTSLWREVVAHRLWLHQTDFTIFAEVSVTTCYELARRPDRRPEDLELEDCAELQRALLDVLDIDTHDVAEGPEICDDKDNDRNGRIDDIELAGRACVPYEQLAAWQAVFTRDAWQTCPGIDELIALDGGLTFARPLPAHCAALLEHTSCSFGEVACSGGRPTCARPGIAPRRETCDGRDEDCNGQVDDGLDGYGTPCVDPARDGQCRVGATACVDGRAVCAETRAPTDEMCDGRDEDCDGQIDEAAPHLGATCLDDAAVVAWSSVFAGEWADADCPDPLGEVVERRDGVVILRGLSDSCGRLLTRGSCQPGRIAACDQGRYICGEHPAGPVVGPTSEVCNGEDDDCDGRVDETPDGVGESCDAPDGPDCAHIQACTRGVLECVVDEAVRSPELCNAIDDDCDGTVDEAPNDSVQGQLCLPLAQLDAWEPILGRWRADGSDCPGDPAALPVRDGAVVLGAAEGQCLDDLRRNACNPGIFGSCLGGRYLCSALAGEPFSPPTDEICNGVDDDCDGVVDEAPLQVGEPCAREAVPDCQHIWSCREGRLTCTPAPGEASEELCDATDNDCDGIVDEVPSENLTGQLCMPLRAAERWPPRLVSMNCPDPELVGEMLVYSDEDGPISQQCEEALLQGECQPGRVGRCRGGRYSCERDGLSIRGPAAFETCNGRDDDCDGLIDEDARTLASGDLPELRVGEPCDALGHAQPQCQAEWICADGRMACELNREQELAQETCDAVDNDCDGRIDEGLEAESSGDICLPTREYRRDWRGHVQQAVAEHECVLEGEIIEDYDDSGIAIIPAMTGLCDRVLSAGICRAGILSCMEGRYECVPVGSDFVSPGWDVCNDKDDDCDGRIDEGVDGPDGMPRVAWEVIDGADNDCDGEVDEGHCSVRDLQLPFADVRRCEGWSFHDRDGDMQDDSWECWPTLRGSNLLNLQAEFGVDATTSIEVTIHESEPFDENARHPDREPHLVRDVSLGITFSMGSNPAEAMAVDARSFIIHTIEANCKLFRMDVIYDGLWHTVFEGRFGDSLDLATPPACNLSINSVDPLYRETLCLGEPDRYPTIVEQGLLIKRWWVWMRKPGNDNDVLTPRALSQIPDNVPTAGVKVELRPDIRIGVVCDDMDPARALQECY